MNHVNQYQNLIWGGRMEYEENQSKKTEGCCTHDCNFIYHRRAHTGDTLATNNTFTNEHDQYYEP